MRIAIPVVSALLAVYLPAAAAETDQPGASPLDASRQPSACSVALGAGYRVMSFGGTETHVWYPTTSPQSSYDYNERISGSVARSGNLANCDRFPLVVFSHGYCGSAIQTVFLTEELARRGYVVAAPNHVDPDCGSSNNAAPQEPPLTSYQEWSDQTYTKRRDDVRRVLDGMLADPQFASIIDPEKIGGIGHSLGGYTIFGLAGGWESWYEPRIKAALLLSPYLHAYRYNNRISAVRIPLMYQSGGTDGDRFVTQSLTGEDNNPKGAIYQLSNRPKFYGIVGGAGHFAWTNISCQGQPVAECVKNVPNVRTINTYSFDFLDRYLKQQERPALFSGLNLFQEYFRETPVAAVPSASFDGNAPLAPNQIGSAFGEGLTLTTVAAEELPLPTELGGVYVSVTDSAGVTRGASLFFVSPNQVNFLVPPDSAAGTATVKVQQISTNEVLAAGSIEIQRSSPALYAANGTGSGVAAAEWVRNEADGNQTRELVFDPETRAARPISLANGDVYLSLYGTGLRGADPSTASATVGGIATPVTEIAPQAEYLGLDQVNIGPLPRELAGRGSVDIVLTLDGRQANVVTVTIE
ncbi:MAG: hypothetical protein IRZ15_13415 [Bryobacteraceae bacterium]|nr:hypothetical protein [Bryobacteraceae bacterium]